VLRGAGQLEHDRDTGSQVRTEGRQSGEAQPPVGLTDLDVRRLFVVLLDLMSNPKNRPHTSLSPRAGSR